MFQSVTIDTENIVFKTLLRIEQCFVIMDCNFFHEFQGCSITLQRVINRNLWNLDTFNSWFLGDCYCSMFLKLLFEK